MMQKVHFRLTSVAQKRCCLSSLMPTEFRVDSFAGIRVSKADAFACWNFVIVFKLKNNKKFQQANVTAMYTYMLQMSPPFVY